MVLLNSPVAEMGDKGCHFMRSTAFCSLTPCLFPAGFIFKEKKTISAVWETASLTWKLCDSMCCAFGTLVRRPKAVDQAHRFYDVPRSWPFRMVWSRVSFVAGWCRAEAQHWPDSKKPDGENQSYPCVTPVSFNDSTENC